MPASAADVNAAILAAVQQRGPDKTLCPSEIARALAPDDWRELMPVVRDAALGLAAGGQITIRQGGVVRDPTLPLKGPIRLGPPLAD